MAGPLVRPLIFAMLILANDAAASAGDVELCDAAGVCLRGDEAMRFEAARTAVEERRWDEAVAALEALRTARRADEAPASLLVVNDLAVALSSSSRRIEAALLLEGYLGDRADLGASFGNLLTLYDDLSREDPDLDAANPGPRLETILRRPRSDAPPLVALENAEDGRQDTPGTPVPPPVESELRDALETWRRAWASGDVEAYLDGYVPDASPRAGTPRERWERERRRRVRPDRDIEITLSRIEVDLRAPDEATMRFEQSYRASDYADRVAKRLRWERRDDAWRIRDERVVTP